MSWCPDAVGLFAFVNSAVVSHNNMVGHHVEYAEQFRSWCTERHLFPFRVLCLLVSALHLAQLGWFEIVEVFSRCCSHPFPLVLINLSFLTLQERFLCSSLTAYHLSPFVVEKMAGSQPE